MLLGGLILMKGRIGQLGFVLLSPAFVLLYTKNTQQTRLRWLWAGGLSLGLAAGMYFGFEGVRQPFNEAYDELIESQTGYPTSEPSYSSIGQRVAFYQEYWPLFLENPFFGVGTGDLVKEGKPLFADNPFGIPFNKPHNQFYETTLKFGLFGLILLLLTWGYTIRAFNPAFRKLAYLFSLLLFLSMWSDSTFGTQGGMSFFMVFTALFLVRHNDPVWVQSDAPSGELESQTQLNASGLR
jgi:O-antigen ligase